MALSRMCFGISRAIFPARRGVSFALLTITIPCAAGVAWRASRVFLAYVNAGARGFRSFSRPAGPSMGGSPDALFVPPKSSSLLTLGRGAGCGPLFFEGHIMTLQQMDWGVILDAAQAGRLPNLLTWCFPERVAGVMGGRGMAYVATPYSREACDGDGLWNFQKSRDCARLAALEVDALRVAGVSGVSPIVMAHAMVEFTGAHQAIGHGGAIGFAPRIDPLDAAMWLRWCMPVLSAASCLVVPDLPGWDRSLGIKAEVMAAIDHGKPVFLYAGAK